METEEREPWKWLGPYFSKYSGWPRASSDAPLKQVAPEAV